MEGCSRPWKGNTRAQKIRRRNRLREAALEAYGDRCACCGETHRDALAIDHVFENGAAHRREIQGRTHSGDTKFLLWLKTHDYPDGFQLLCHNCNFSKHINGGFCAIHQRQLMPANSHVDWRVPRPLFEVCGVA
jgi:hypothetical protein